jgi:hypothetical protein
MMSYHYNSELGDFIDRMYAIELEKKDTTDIARYTSFIGIHPEIDSADLFIILFYVEIVISIKHLHQSLSTLNKFCRNMCNVKIGSGSSIFRVFLICTYYLKLRYIFSIRCRRQHYSIGARKFIPSFIFVTVSFSYLTARYIYYTTLFIIYLASLQC